MMEKTRVIRMPNGVPLEERFAEGKQKAKDQNGQEVDQAKYFFGYKGHVSMNAESNLITSLEVTSGEAYQTIQLTEKGRLLVQGFIDAHFNWINELKGSA